MKMESFERDKTNIVGVPQRSKNCWWDQLVYDYIDKKVGRARAYKYKNTI
jgi:hypothetical protein